MTTPQNFRVPITLFTNVVSIIPYANWVDPLNPSDPWTGYPYQWQVTANIHSQTHSDPETPIPYTYNGLSVVIGNWLIFNNSSIAVEIISITSQNDQILTFIVEDIGLSNIVNDPAQSGVGIGSVSDQGVYDCLIINLNSEGIPVFASIPDYTIPINLISDIVNRFQFHNYIQDFIPGNQPGNNFQIGDIIYLNEDGSYTASISTNYRSTQSIGTVTTINQPDVGNFTYRPVNRYVTNLPTLPGYPGDMLYISSTTPGGVTNVVTAGDTIPVYIKITDNSAIFTSGSSSGSGSVSFGEIAFGGTVGQLVGNSELTFDSATTTLSIGNIRVTGDYITTSVPGNDLILSANVANVQITTTLDMAGNQLINYQLGNVTSGTWNATVIGYQYGGTGNTTIGSPGQVLGVDLTGTVIQYLNHSQITESASPPTFPIPSDGDRWYNTVYGVLFTYITDDTGNHWVQL